MTTRNLLQILAVVATLVAATPAEAERRYALVIGANAGWSSDRPLRFAETDASRVRDVLVGFGGFAPDRVELLRDPSTSDVRAALRKLATTARDDGEDTLVFVYYSGHADDKHLHLRGDALSHRELQDTLRSLPVTIKLGVVDACKSGAVTRKGGAPVDEFNVDVVNPKVSGMVLLTSSGADELSLESRSLAGSVFTHHLVSGMRGAADENADRQVTVMEAYQYAYTRTRAATAIGATQQRPAFRYELSGQGEVVLTTLKANHDVSLVVPRGSAQRYVVLDSHEWRLIGEAVAEPKRDVVLALTSGNYRVKRLREDRIEVASLNALPGARVDVNLLSYQTMPLSAGVIKGDPNDLGPVEHHEWERARAYGMLADGQATGALVIFDQLLRESPDDVLAWRGRGRALVRLAEAYQRVNDRVHERQSLADALRADPSLSEDPLFQIWYQRLGEADARAWHTFDRKQQFDRDVKKNPRTVKRYGVGFDLFSARGLFSVSGGVVVHRMFFPSVAVDIAGAGLDANLTIAPSSGRWSPYLGLGAHVSARRLGLDLGAEGSSTVANADGSEPMFSAEEMWGAHARIEGGGQLVSNAGFTMELGFAMMLFRSDEGKSVQQLWPVIHLGWLW
jgi:hypothetical protein